MELRDDGHKEIGFECHALEEEKGRGRVALGLVVCWWKIRLGRQCRSLVVTYLYDPQMLSQLSSLQAFQLKLYRLALCLHSSRLKLEIEVHDRMGLLRVLRRRG